MNRTTARHGRFNLIVLACCLLAGCGGDDEGGGIANISLSATAQSPTQIALSWSEPDGIISFSPYVIARRPFTPGTAVRRFGYGEIGVYDRGQLGRPLRRERHRIIQDFS